MKCAIILALVAVAFCDYEQVLQSPGQLMALFSKYSGQYNKHYSAAEAPMRLRLFRTDLKKVVQLNKEHGDEWQSGLNAFSDMTQEEKAKYLGLNVTSAQPPKDEDIAVEKRAPSADYLDWRQKGKVTGIKNQAGCGSCWAFAAVGAVETNYAIMTGRRKQFSDQEYVDCTYSSSRDSCKGGWYYEAWDYSGTSGRLSTEKNTPYVGKDGACRYSSKPNGLMAATINGAKFVRKGEHSVISQLNSGAVSVAFEVTDAFWKYTIGIISDSTCISYVNHAVTAVGYTRGAMIIKNSWGDWGMNGYFYTRRGHAGCQIFDHGAYPDMRSTGRADTDDEYVPVDDDTCDGTNADGCPCGTARCSSGKCKHPHMC